jgi:hypothetical protein
MTIGQNIDDPTIGGFDNLSDGGVRPDGRVMLAGRSSRAPIGGQPPHGVLRIGPDGALMTGV